METKKMSIPVRDMVYTACFTAVLCAVAPFSIRIGPIPLSLATLMIYLASGTLSWKYSAMTVVLYIALGAIGLPVFSDFEGGFHKIAGVSGGFIIGYIPLVLIIGISIRNSRKIRWMYLFGMVIGTALLYTCGVIWFIFQMETTLAAALMACVIPFIIGDTIKIILAFIITPQLRTAMLRNAECKM